LPNGKIQSLLKINEGFGSPDLLRQFLARYHLANPADEDGEDAGLLRLEFLGYAVAA
jgi:hypothetical protein